MRQLVEKYPDGYEGYIKEEASKDSGQEQSVPDIDPARVMSTTPAVEPV
jgi:hypothetical protein